MAKPPTVVELRWERDLVLSGTAGAAAMTLDSAGTDGPSPMQAVALALASCMAMDVIAILKKGRRDLRALRAQLTGTRAEEDPRRFIAIALHYEITGDVQDDVVQRAIDLSLGKYCSVWHSLRQDLPFDITFTIHRP